MTPEREESIRLCLKHGRERVSPETYRNHVGLLLGEVDRLRAELAECEEAKRKAQTLAGRCNDLAANRKTEITHLKALVARYVKSHDDDEAELQMDAGFNTITACDCNLCGEAREVVRPLPSP
jgi:hypothetical protein